MDNSDPAEDDPYSEAMRAIDCLRDSYNSNSTSPPEDRTKRNYDAYSEAEADGETEETSTKKLRNNSDDPVLSQDIDVLRQMWGPPVAGDMLDFSDLLLEEVTPQSVNEHLQNLLTAQGYNASEDSNSLTACSEINDCLPSTSMCGGGETVPNISHVISDIVQPVAGDMLDFSDLLLLEEVTPQSVNEHLQNLLTAQGYNASEDSNSLTACSEINDCLPSTSTFGGGETVPNISHVISDIVQPVAGDMLDFSDLLLLEEVTPQSVNEHLQNLLTAQGYNASEDSNSLTACSEINDCLPSTSTFGGGETVPNISHVTGISNIDVLGPDVHEDISSQNDLNEPYDSCENIDIDNEKNATTRTKDPLGDTSDILLQAIEAIGGLQNQVGGEGRTSSDEEMFEITERPGLHSKKFKTTETMFTINLNRQVHESLWSTHLDILTRALQNVLDILNSRLNDNDLVRVYIAQQGLDTPIILHLRPLHEVTVQALLAMIEKVLQSKDTLKFDETFEIHVAYIELPKGRGKTHRKPLVNLMTSLKGLKSVVTIDNKDNMCLARSIVVGRSKIEDTDRQFKKIRRQDRPTTQGLLAKDLCRTANVDPNKPAGLDDIPRFEKAINRRICVISAEHFNKVIYKGDQTIMSSKQIYLYLHHDHFDTIINAKGFYGYGHFCHRCVVPYYHLGSHVCEKTCGLCFSDKCIKGQEVFCKDCNRYCRNNQCFESHKQGRTNIHGEETTPSCDKTFKCLRCNILVSKSRKEKHKCGEKYCRECSMYCTDDHRCFMKPTAAPKPQSKFIFFDFETTQDTSIHIVNYCVAHRVCSKCIDIEDISTNCELCGERQFVFKGENALNEFSEWLISDVHKDFTVMAHNLKSFDGHFLLNYMLKNGIKPEIIYNNTKIMKLEIKCLNMVLIDSLNHLPIKLAALPKAFGLESLHKGFFPFYFNVPENQTYVGDIVIPDPKFYGIDSMHAKEREEFLVWYASQKEKNVIFDFQEEIRKYTISDVDILRKCCLKYRKLILDISRPDESEGRPYSHGVDPFSKLTVASFCFTLFKHLFLKPNTIARVPAQGITHDKFSKLSILWLDWLAFKSEIDGNQKIHIKHALNGGEKRVGKYKCDGLAEITDTETGVTTKRVYSYDGCFWHGCPSCYSSETYNPKADCTMGELHRKTLQRDKNLREMGVEHVSIWECQFKKEMNDNPEILNMIGIHREERLCPRDAFYGGRTNACRLYYEVKKGEKIKYYDFCSLYPYINKTGIYPVGFPEVITSNFQPLESYTGFAKVKVLPPRGLYHPVLPFRCNGKLMFPLCRLCCENELPVCSHNEEQRAFVGTFVTLELNYAIERGYKVLKTYEVFHFKETQQYDQNSHTGGLFTPYINMFLKIKQESSGWPSWIKSECDKKQYLETYEKREGISLEPEKIEINPGLRSLSKSLLVNFWGKMGERQCHKQNNYIMELSEFYDLIFDVSKEIENIRVITEEVILVEWIYKADFNRTSSCSNVFNAAFTTAQARLKLHSVLEQLGDRVLYHDTDSIIFVSREGEPEPEVGVFLGDLTDELPKGQYIVIFVSGGPKNYAYITNTGMEVCKVRGFSLNYKNSQIINFNSVCQMVKNVQNIHCKCVPQKVNCRKCSPTLTTSNTKICRSKEPVTVFNREEKKRLQDLLQQKSYS